MTEHTYLPAIANEQPVAGQSDDVAEFVRCWLQALGDKAKQMRFDSRLAAAAQRQADWLQAHDFTPGAPHLGENGITANERVSATGYRLPGWWPAKGNLVESATRSWDVDMAEIVGDLMNHATHYDHMHVINWYAQHTVYGVGVAGTYFVVVTAPPEG